MNFRKVDNLGKKIIELNKEELDFLVFIFTKLHEYNIGKINLEEWYYHLCHPLSIRLIPVFYASYHPEAVMGTNYFPNIPKGHNCVIVLPKKYVWVYDAFAYSNIFLQYWQMIRWLKTIRLTDKQKFQYISNELRNYKLKRDMTLTLSGPFSFRKTSPTLFNMKPWPVAPDMIGFNEPYSHWM